MAWLFVSQALTWMVTLLLLVVSPRKLSTSDFGLLSFTGAFVGFFSFAAQLGTGPYITREVARNPDLLGRYVYNGLVMKAAVAVVLAAGAVGTGLALGYSSTSIALIEIGTGGMFLTVLADVAVGGLAGINRLARPAAWGVVQSYSTAVLALGALYGKLGVLGFAGAVVVGAILPQLAIVKSSWAFVDKQHRTIDFALWKRTLRGGLPLLVLSGLILIYGTIDIPLLEWLGDSDAVAHYSLAYRWAGIPVFISTIVISTASPSLSAYAHGAAEKFAALANESLRFVLVISIAAATGIVVIAYDLMSLLYSDHKYDASAPLIRILAIHLPLVTISSLLGAILFTSDRQNLYTKYALIAAITNPPVTIGVILLTKHTFHNPAAGAAIATVATEMFMTWGAYRLRPQGVFDRATKWFALRCLAASAVMATPLVVFDGLEIFAKVVLGLVLYIVASLLFRTFRLQDVRNVVDQLRGSRRFGGRADQNTEVEANVVSDEH